MNAFARVRLAFRGREHDVQRLAHSHREIVPQVLPAVAVEPGALAVEADHLRELALPYGPKKQSERPFAPQLRRISV